jgi:hypothetical protein
VLAAGCSGELSPREISVGDVAGGITVVVGRSSRDWREHERLEVLEIGRSLPVVVRHWGMV